MFDWSPLIGAAGRPIHTEESRVVIYKPVDIVTLVKENVSSHQNAFSPRLSRSTTGAEIPSDLCTLFSKLPLTNVSL